jgi:hypothetical protein
VVVRAASLCRADGWLPSVGCLAEPGRHDHNVLVTDPTVSCQVCGRRPEPTGAEPGTGQDAGPVTELLSWVMDRRDGRTSWTCPACAASNIRALEAKLEPEWW